MNKYQEIEQQIADALFINHGLVLNKGSVDGTTIGLEVNEMRSGSDRMYGYYKRGTGKYQVRVGTSYKLRSVGFKQLKSGGFNIDKIADKMVEMRNELDSERLRREAKEDRIRNRMQVVEALRVKHNIKKYAAPLSVSEYGSINFRVTSLTAEQAEQLQALAVQLGIVKTEETH